MLAHNFSAPSAKRRVSAAHFSVMRRDDLEAAGARLVDAATDGGEPGLSGHGVHGLHISCSVSVQHVVALSCAISRHSPAPSVRPNITLRPRPNTTLRPEQSERRTCCMFVITAGAEAGASRRHPTRHARASLCRSCNNASG